MSSEINIERSRNEIDLLRNLTKILKGSIEAVSLYHTLNANGLLKYIKKYSTCHFKIKTVKICFILEDGTHMHKDIDWEEL